MRSRVKIIANIGSVKPVIDFVEEGHIIEIKNVLFRIGRIDTGKIILRYLPKDKQVVNYTIE